MSTQIDTLKLVDGDDYLEFRKPLPEGLLVLDCSYVTAKRLPDLPSSLTYMWCNYNTSLKELPPLPSALFSLECCDCQLTELPPLPDGLAHLWCSNNTLSSLPKLPSTLNTLSCYNNQLECLPTLPASLRKLDCSSNYLRELPALPALLEHLDCASNLIGKLPKLGDVLSQLNCSDNRLARLPALPSCLQMLICRKNYLERLPKLPDLITLDCTLNKIKMRDLPELPASLRKLVVQEGEYSWPFMTESMSVDSVARLVRLSRDAAAEWLTAGRFEAETTPVVLRALLAEGAEEALLRWHQLAGMLHVLGPKDRLAAEEALSRIDYSESMNML